MTDETEDERRDFADPGRSLFESEHGPVMGNDGDDNREYAQPKQKIVTDKLGDQDVTKPEDIIYPVSVKQHPADNPPGQMVADGHGFIVNNPRSRPGIVHAAITGSSAAMPLNGASILRAALGGGQRTINGDGE